VVKTKPKLTIIAVIASVGILLAYQNTRKIVQVVVTFTQPTYVAVSWIIGEQRDDEVAHSSPYGVQRVASPKDIVVVVAKPVSSTKTTNNTIVQIKVDGEVRRTCTGLGAQGVSCKTKV
jgi:hypothetical protein